MINKVNYRKNEEIINNSDDISLSIIENSQTIKVELHCHSHLSDGELTPEQLAEKLSKASVKYAALTDHNSIAGLDTFKHQLSKFGIGFISGIELTTIHNNILIHLLAYGFNSNNKELISKLEEVKSVNDADSPLVPRVSLTTKDAINIIHQAGGVTILAHPFKTEPNFVKISNIISELKELGLDGVEAVYAFDSLEERDKILDLAHKKGLIVSAGSDFHTSDKDIGIDIDNKYWKNFKNSILKNSHRNPGISNISAEKVNSRSNIKWLEFILNIFLPAAMALILFIIALFFILLPYFEQSLLERKRDTIQELTKAAIGVLDEAAFEAESSQINLEHAQDLAKKRIEAMRYGKDGKEYFWLQDTTPKILMHPYRPDLNNKDVSEFKDARNVKIFVEFVNLVKEKNEGFISYVWQWNDNKDRLEAKESYIRLFEKWNWIIGTGIYDTDVKDEIATLRSHFIKVSLIIVAMVLILLLYLVKNGMKIEKSKLRAEELLRESIERYRILTEAATEGALFISKSRLVYANAVMYELLGCDESHLGLLEIDDIFPDVEANSIIRIYLHNAHSVESMPSFRGIINRCDGSLLNCNLTLKYGNSRLGDEYMVLVRRIMEGKEYNERKLDLEKLLRLPTKIASDIAEAISKARQISDIVIICGRTQELVQSLLESSASATEITRMLSTVTDAATKKLISIAINEIGTPPTDFVFLALGSHGRESQTLYSDQDNAIIYRMNDETDKEKVSKYFQLLANIVCDGLALTGYRKCDGQKMANNSKWCQPLQVWKKYFEGWIKNSYPEDIMELSVFFDFRAVFGDFELEKELRSYLNSELIQSPQFIVQLAKNALSFNPPIRLFGNIVTTGGKEHPGCLDIKAPNLAIVSFIRLYALRHGILETNTIARLDAITRMGIVLDSTRRDIITAYEALLRLRLWNQAMAIQNNQELSNWIAPGNLGHIEEVILKECFKEIELLQGRIQRDFFGGNNIF